VYLHTSLDDEERMQVTEQFNATAADYPKEAVIQELFEAQVERTPEGVAVVYEEEQLTYRELNRRANQLARYLRRRGIGPEEAVGIAVERSPEMIVGLLGILKSGGAYVPLDAGYPAERLAYMLEDAGPRVVLTQERLRDRLPETSAGVILLDRDWPEIAQEDGMNLTRSDAGVSSRNLAYVIYTSGSTGQPKGVMVEHRGLCNLAHARVAALDLHPNDRLLQFASLSFDVCSSEVATALCSGATLCLAARADLMPGEPLAATIAGLKITHALITVGAMAALPADRDLTSLKTLIVGGEACPASVVQRWAAGRRLINEYGPTETTVVASMYPCDPQEEGDPPIGRPIANTRIYILDGERQPVPIGAVGELYIGGVGVARGYRNRPDLTAERFLKDPFSGEPEARMYRTGDLGRWRADGNIEYVGRGDDQVKIRGYRIELGEIETQLRRHPTVNEAVVMAREDRPGEKRLVAYVTAADGGVSADMLRTHLKGALPDYMVPAAVVVLERLPLTANGKVDRKALPEPDVEALERQPYRAPEGPMEEELARIWQELLEVERVGRDDNFFDLGGHSLLAVAAESRLRSAGIGVPLIALFQHPTIKTLAEHLLNATQSATQETPVRLRDGGNRRPLFILHGATGDVFPYLLLARHLQEGVPVYGLPFPADSTVDSVQKLAEKHINAMRQAQPAGPYRLAGHSFGGVVAYEMAVQLNRNGESVEFLGLIDSFRPDPSRDLTDEIPEILGLLLQADDDLHAHPDDNPRHALEMAKHVGQLQERCERMNLLPKHLSLEQVQERLRIYRKCIQAVQQYDAPPLSAPLYLFAVQDSSEQDRGWSPLVRGQLHIEVVDGTHVSMIQMPHVRRLAQAMSGALDQAERKVFSMISS